MNESGQWTVSTPDEPIADEERVMAARRESFPELLERLGIDLSVTLVRDDTTNPVITYVPKEDQ